MTVLVPHYGESIITGLEELLGPTDRPSMKDLAQAKQPSQLGSARSKPKAVESSVMGFIVAYKPDEFHNFEGRMHVHEQGCKRVSRLSLPPPSPTSLPHLLGLPPSGLLPASSLTDHSDLCGWRAAARDTDTHACRLYKGRHRHPPPPIAPPISGISHIRRRMTSR